ncbi:MAG: hypothetical protein AAF413_01015 [Patescibacteria group bacterium]
MTIKYVAATLIAACLSIYGDLFLRRVKKLYKKYSDCASEGKIAIYAKRGDGAISYAERQISLPGGY